MVKYGVSNLQQFPAKICYTVAAVLVHDGKVLLVRHKKLSMWLNPGGHVEEKEMPHRAAEREFFEETGVKVRAIDPFLPPDLHDDTEFVPNPILTNLHWVSKDNFEKRQKSPNDYQLEEKWQRGCEQHLNFMYLVEPVGSVEFVMEPTEITDIRWFTKEEIVEADLHADIRYEINRAFELAEKNA